MSLYDRIYSILTEYKSAEERGKAVTAHELPRMQKFKKEAAKWGTTPKKMAQHRGDVASIQRQKRIDIVRRGRPTKIALASLENDPNIPGAYGDEEDVHVLGRKAGISPKGLRKR